MEKTIAALQGAGIFFERDCSLRAHSSFHIGGIARLAVFPEEKEQLIRSLQELSSNGVPFTVVGNATNLVFDDAGFNGAVIFTSRMRWAEVQKERLIASAGASLRALSTLAREHALSGMEFACGIPGTLGGALFMNAGAYGGEIGSLCQKSVYYDLKTNRIGEIEGEAHQWRARGSVYQDHPERIVLQAELVLSRGNAEEIGARMEELLQKRRASQPLEHPNAGSVFKRPPGDFAARLIDACGLKGMRVGGAEVSQKHAGFIVNRGDATATDVRRLVEAVRDCVYQKTGVLLECEIRFVKNE